MTLSKLAGRPEFTAAQICAHVQDRWGLDGEVSPLVSERDQNWLVRVGGRPVAVAKIANRGDDAGHIDLQRQMMQRLHSAGLPCPDLLPAADGHWSSRLGGHVSWVIEFLPGTALASAAASPRVFGDLVGNGFPLGAVVTTRAIADSFDNGMEYFNTFGGSPVSCAAGLAVLDVLEEEELQEHARVVGNRLLTSLREVGTRHPGIGDVRGAGLFVGVEFVADNDTREPDAHAARAVVHRLREERILISTDGPDDNVLKIKPPLPFTGADADRLAEAVDRALARG